MKFIAAAPLALAVLAAADSSVKHDHQINTALVLPMNDTAFSVIELYECSHDCFSHSRPEMCREEDISCACTHKERWTKLSVLCHENRCMLDSKEEKTPGMIASVIEATCQEIQQRDHNVTAPVLGNGTAGAQPQNATDPAVPSIPNMPECAVTCIAKAIKKATKCAMADTPCLCAHGQKIAKAAQGCVLKSCGLAKAIKEVIPAGKAQCASK
ncbi:Extracellular membrane protein, CFEM domain protein [Akanthomyces lecanii RCEF 1005]|uniref:Extracellular membrane protein, CFEM domain protein n=1 Tax=Akanthomyces lecanii RCEF 1005 TaxID=1081108 RepID=A0A168GPL5_CORDF|nr:Extracellular membrane protein, CFEM domain protein [Akanthomyces lecanii RCEF 1005]